MQQFNRELSWLSFNYRVLQEAKNESTPLLDRLRFLAIYSSNLDEFFRVRVASLKSFIKLNKKTIHEIHVDPMNTLKEINEVVVKQQEEFGEVYRNQIIPALEKHQVFIANENSLDNTLKDIVKNFFAEQIKPLVTPVFLKPETELFLENRRLYLVFALKAGENSTMAEDYAVLEIPSSKVPRFHSFMKDNKYYVLFLDDIIRLCLDTIFPNRKINGCYSIKISRDAELYIDDEFSGDLVKKIRKNLEKRDTGLPSRFLYDKEMPDSILKILQEKLQLHEEDRIPGGKYHNYNDFGAFPNPDARLPEFSVQPALPQVQLEATDSMFSYLKHKDALVYYPYQKYDYVIRFIEEAANDSKVTDIKITLYRVAENSKVAKALLKAAQNGKSVTVFVEVKARFDEESNLYWAEELENAGAKVLYSIPGLKVHCKLCLVTRMKEDKKVLYAYISTGNFNEKTAKIYTDIGFFTSDKTIAKDAEKVFKQLAGNIAEQDYQKLLVAPNHLRAGLERLIETEIEYAGQGKEASIFMKLNSLEDQEMISKLYEASKAGVKINIIVRGICCLVPGVKGVSENIHVISIVGRYLEHSRIYLFHHGGEKKIYISSADWMKRNLSHRVEVAVPIENELLKKELISILELLWSDNVKARIIHEHQDNVYRKSNSEEKVNAQEAIYKYLEKEQIVSV